MFASIRRYRLRQGPIKDLARRVDDGFAEEISAQPGFASYEFIDCGEGEVITLSVFGEADQAEASRNLAHRWTEQSLRDFESLGSRCCAARSSSAVPCGTCWSRGTPGWPRSLLACGATGCAAVRWQS